MKRLFVAVEMSDIEEINLLYQLLYQRLSHENIRWTKPENLHITLKFLGSTPANRVPALVKKLDFCAQRSGPVTLHAERLGVFGSRYQPRVLWLGFRPDETLKALASCLKRELISLGFPDDRQNFVPHLSFGRIKQLGSKKYFQQVLDQCQPVDIAPVCLSRFGLIESVLTPEGPSYHLLKNFDLPPKKFPGPEGSGTGDLY